MIGKGRVKKTEKPFSTAGDIASIRADFKGIRSQYGRLITQAQARRTFL